MDRTGEEQWDTRFCAGDIPITIHSKMTLGANKEPVLEVEILMHPEVPVPVLVTTRQKERKDD